MKASFLIIPIMTLSCALSGLIVTFPNGGETLVKGNVYNITWRDGNTGNVAISLINGSHNFSITKSTENDGVYAWKVPVDLARYQSRIKISSVSNASISDHSDGFFNLEEPTINITSPKSGDVLREGSEHTITWTSNCYEGEVFMVCQGVNSSMISWAAPNSGSYKWKVPDPGGEKRDDCRIVIKFNNYVTPSSKESYGEYFTIVADYNSISSSPSGSSSTASSTSSSTSKEIPGFVFVQGGTFNNSAANVTVSSFYIDKYEVTQSSYNSILGTNPSYFKSHANLPVEMVSWYDAIKYCNLRSIKENLTPCYNIKGTTNPNSWGTVPSEENNAAWDPVVCNWKANGYRLPTEAEWEYAAKGGNKSHNYTYSGSNDLNTVGWYQDNSGEKTHVVGQLASNELGVYDMSGNVSEWCWDWYGNYSKGSQINPTGPASGSDRLERGGNWNYDPIMSRVTSRFDCFPYGYGGSTGFRICRAAN